jgi:hypothetical protein
MVGESAMFSPWNTFVQHYNSGGALGERRAMKKCAALFGVCLLFSFAALAQHHSEGGGGHIPSHGPTPVHNPHPAPENRHYNDKTGHPTHLTSIPTASGSATTADATILTTTSIIPGSTGALRAASVEAMFGTWREAAPVASGSAVSTSASPRWISPSAMAGSGTAMTSSSMRIPTMTAGTSLAT